MRKFLAAFILLCVFVFGATAFKTDNSSAAYKPGTKIPAFVVENASGRVVIGETDAKYTLLLFWNSHDASARIDCKHFDLLFKNNDSLSSACDFVAVNLDESSVIFEEIVKCDALAPDNQFHVKAGHIDRVREIYHLAEGFNTVLLDSEGMIVALNPGENDIASFVVG